MSKYIDAEKLIAEIERRIAAYQKNFDKADNKIAKLSTDGRIAGLKALLPFITSLQQEQPEVDLEKEIDSFLNRNVLNRINNSDIIEDFTTMEAGELARHFYELGLNARKKEITQEELIQYWRDKASIYANDNAQGQFTWVRDALYVAYLTGVQESIKIRLL